MAQCHLARPVDSSTADSVFERAGRSTRRQWNNARRSILFTHARRDVVRAVVGSSRRLNRQGVFVARLLFDTMDYDLTQPIVRTPIISCTSRTQALGLYAMWALRNEVARIAAPDLLPRDEIPVTSEDLLRFRRNPQRPRRCSEISRETPRRASRRRHHSLGYPPAHLASGVPASFVWRGLRASLPRRRSAFISSRRGRNDTGTCGRNFRRGGAASLDNLILHIDWNQASIDSNHVCATAEPGRPCNGRPPSSPICTTGMSCTCRMGSTGSRSPRRNACRWSFKMVSRPRSFIAQSKDGNTASRGVRRTARVMGFAQVHSLPRSRRCCRRICAVAMLRRRQTALPRWS